MKVKDFLEQYIEGYLFSDLNNIQNKITLPLPDGEKYGAAGYPMIVSILAGMEALGFLLMTDGKQFNSNIGKEYFANFWDGYFALEYPAYAGLAKIFRKLVRHGLAHSFITKHGIYITRGSKRRLMVDTRTREIHLDADVFFDEFKEVYAKRVFPIIEGKSAAVVSVGIMQTNLNNILSAYEKDSIKFFSELQPKVSIDTDLPRRSQFGGEGAVSATIVSSSSLSGGFSGPPTPITPSGIGHEPLNSGAIRNP